MKFPKLSTLFSGEAWKKVAAAFSDDEASLEATEKLVADMETKIGQLTTELGTVKTESEASKQKVTGLEGQVKTLTDEKTALEGEKKKLEEKLAETPAGTATTIVKKEDKPDDGGEGKTVSEKYGTSVDKEMAELAEMNENLVIK